MSGCLDSGRDDAEENRQPSKGRWSGLGQAGVSDKDDGPSGFQAYGVAGGSLRFDLHRSYSPSAGLERRGAWIGCRIILYNARRPIIEKTNPFFVSAVYF